MSIFVKYKSFLSMKFFSFYQWNSNAANLISFPTYFPSILLSDLECFLILKGRALLRREICGNFSYATGWEYFVEKIKVGRHKGWRLESGFFATRIHQHYFPRLVAANRLSILVGSTQPFYAQLTLTRRFFKSPLIFEPSEISATVLRRSFGVFFTPLRQVS